MDIKSLIASSADPEKVSLFIKSIVVLAILFGIDTTVANQAGGYLTSLVIGIGMVISAGTALWGLVRKIKLGRWN